MLKRIAVSVLIKLTIVSMLVFYVNLFEAIPYNVRELFTNSSPLLTIFLFTLALYAVFGAPVLLSSWLTVESWTKYLFPLLVVILGAVTWFLLRGSVPIESLHDVIGSPILDWSWEWELIVRFSSLITPPFVLLCGAALLVHTYKASYNYDFRPIVFWSIHAAFLLPFAHWMIVCNAATDNLTELMARGGDSISSVVLGLWIASLGLTQRMLCTNTEKSFLQCSFY